MHLFEQSPPDTHAACLPCQRCARSQIAPTALKVGRTKPRAGIRVQVCSERISNRTIRPTRASSRSLRGSRALFLAVCLTRSPRSRKFLRLRRALNAHAHGWFVGSLPPVPPPPRLMHACARFSRVQSINKGTGKSSDAAGSFGSCSSRLLLPTGHAVLRCPAGGSLRPSTTSPTGGGGPCSSGRARSSGTVGASTAARGSNERGIMTVPVMIFDCCAGMSFCAVRPIN